MPAENHRSRARPELPTLLLFEPYFVLRHTVAAVARDLQLADVVEATTLDGATALLEQRRFDACLMSVADDRQELGLLQRLRGGGLATQSETPVAVITEKCDAGLILTLREMQISRIVLKPFKVKVVLETLSRIIEDRDRTLAIASSMKADAPRH